MLTVRGLAGGYGAAQVLFDVSFEVGAGRGRDPARPQRHGQDHHRPVRSWACCGPRGGEVRFAASPRRLPPYRVAQPGIGLVPEGRQIFPTLTVEENLVATAAARAGRRWTSMPSTTSSRA